MLDPILKASGVLRGPGDLTLAACVLRVIGPGLSTRSSDRGVPGLLGGPAGVGTPLQPAPRERRPTFWGAGGAAEDPACHLGGPGSGAKPGTQGRTARVGEIVSGPGACPASPLRSRRVLDCWLCLQLCPVPAPVGWARLPHLSGAPGLWGLSKPSYSQSVAAGWG